MVVVKRVRKLGARGGSVGASGGTSSARPEFVAKEAPCTHSCPAGTDVRGFLTTLARGGSRGLTEAQAIEEAFYLIAERNPLPAVCGRLCPHHCETGCTREAYDGGVSVNQVERAIAEAAINASWALRRLEDGRRPEAVTVVGAGAAGLSAAYQLARRGYDVTVADPHEQPGGELRYGIDAARLPRAVLDAEIDRILALGVTFVGSVDLTAVEAGAPRVVKTQVYESGTPVATGSIAAAVHFGRHAAALLDAEIRGAVADPAVRLPPVDTGKVMVDHFPRQTRGRAARGDVVAGGRRFGSAALPELRRLLRVRQLLEVLPRSGGHQAARAGTAVSLQARVLPGGAASAPSSARATTSRCDSRRFLRLEHDRREVTHARRPTSHSQTRRTRARPVAELRAGDEARRRQQSDGGPAARRPRAVLRRPRRSLEARRRRRRPGLRRRRHRPLHGCAGAIPRSRAVPHHARESAGRVVLHDRRAADGVRHLGEARFRADQPARRDGRHHPARNEDRSRSNRHSPN